MKVIFFSVKDFEEPYFLEENKGNHIVQYSKELLNDTTVSLTTNFDAVVVSHVDVVDEYIIEILNANGVKFIATRSKGVDNINIEAAQRHGIKVANVPDYSPHAIAEHAILLLLSIVRQLLLGQTLMKRHDFRIHKLVGFDLFDKEVSVIGYGEIGKVITRILLGFGCKVFVYDPYYVPSSKDLHVQFVSLHNALKSKKAIFLSCPLTKETFHLIGKKELAKMANDTILINTARGEVLDTIALVSALNKHEILGAGLDVIEDESKFFSKNLAGSTFMNYLLEQLIEMPNVIITPHRAYLTAEALEGRAKTTFKNLNLWQEKYTPDMQLNLSK